MVKKHSNLISLTHLHYNTASQNSSPSQKEMGDEMEPYKTKPFKYSGSRLAFSWNFLNHLSKISIGTTNFEPSTPQKDCMKLKRFSPTFRARRSIRFSAVTSSDCREAKSSTETPILAETGAESAGMSCIWPLGSGHGSVSTAEGVARVTAPQKRKWDPGDWIYTARALSGGRVKLFNKKMHISRIWSYASPNKTIRNSN